MQLDMTVVTLHAPRLSPSTDVSTYEIVRETWESLVREIMWAS